MCYQNWQTKTSNDRGDDRVNINLLGLKRCTITRTQSTMQRVMGAEEWTCGRCTLVNSAGSIFCATCGGFRAGGGELLGWPCPRCTLRNDPRALACSTCSFPHPLDPATQKVEVGQCVNARFSRALSLAGSGGFLAADSRNNYLGGGWECGRCTFANPPAAAACEMCLNGRSAPRPTSRPRPSPAEKDRRVEETEALEKWRVIVRYCADSGSPFTDDAFPAAAKSLYFGATATPGDDPVTQWLRPDQIRTDCDPDLEWTVFRKPIPSDISQGVLGDCWLLSALAVLSEREDLLRNIIVQPEYCRQGVYHVRLCKYGRWRTVVVDDLFPCDRRGNLVYSQAKRKQLWVPLIEKAVAKVHGCYASLVSGRAIEGLATLTGAPCESVPLQPAADDDADRDLIWAQLLSSWQARYLMGASCGCGNMKVDDEHYQAMGLRPRHSYSVLDVRDVRGGPRLVQLRNPWGHFSWRGAWADDAPQWTPRLRALLMPLGASDGIFWLSFDDLLRYFDCVDICKIRAGGWHEQRFAGLLPPLASHRHLSCLRVSVTHPTETELSLFQEGQRNSERSSRSQLDLCALIFETKRSPGPGVGRLVEHSRRQVKGFVGCHKMLEPDDYIVLCLAFNHWHTGMEEATSYPDFALALHSSRQVSVEQVSPPDFILADAIINLTLAKGQRHEGREGMTAYYLTKGWAGLVVVVENRHDNKWIQVKCDCQESYNVVSTRGALTTIDSVPPLHRQVIIVLTQLEGSGGFSIAHRLIHRLSASTGLHDWGPPAVAHLPPLDHQVDGLHAPRIIS